MKGVTYVILSLFILLVQHSDKKHLAKAASGIHNIPEDDLVTIKDEFTKPVMEALLRYNGFHRKFEVPYLYFLNALSYTTEVARATAYSPLFSSSEGIEEYVVEHLLKKVLSCSPAYCSGARCMASAIGDILSEIIIEGGFVTHRIPDRIIKMYAGNLAGNILWRLGRLPDPDSHILESLNDAPAKLINDYAKLLRLLSVKIRNSTLVHSFCDERGIDEDTSVFLSTAICGSRFMGFKLGLLTDLSASMLESYRFARKVLPVYLDTSLSSSMVSAIVAEVITFGMIKEGYLKGDENLEEVSRDVLKMILLGITKSKMNLSSSKVFVKYSPAKDRKKVSGLSQSAQQTVRKAISSDLVESEVFRNLFRTAQIPSQRLETYASKMTEGLRHSVPHLPVEVFRTFDSRLTRALISVAKSGGDDPSVNLVEMFSDGISKTLMDVAMEMNLIGVKQDLTSLSNTFHQITQSILQSLETFADKSEYESKPSPTSAFKIFDKLSAITHFLSSYWGR